MENEDEIIEDKDEAPVVKTGYDAVPIHFRPGKTPEKRIKLVIPGVEPPLLHAVIKGEDPEHIEIEIISQEEIDSDKDEPKGEVFEGSEDAAVVADEAGALDNAEVQPMDAEDLEQAEEEAESMEALDNILEEMPDADTTEEQSEEEEVPAHAGILIANDSDADQQVIVVYAMDGESDAEAVKRVQADHEDYRVGTLDQAIELLGHSPLTAEDN